MNREKTVTFIRQLENTLKELLGAVDVQIVIDIDHPEDLLGDCDESILENTKPGTAYRKAE